mgnify:CR=1 FL=1
MEHVELDGRSKTLLSLSPNAERRNRKLSSLNINLERLQNAKDTAEKAIKVIILLCRALSWVEINKKRYSHTLISSQNVGIGTLFDITHIIHHRWPVERIQNFYLTYCHVLSVYTCYVHIYVFQMYTEDQFSANMTVLPYYINKFGICHFLVNREIPSSINGCCDLAFVSASSAKFMCWQSIQQLHSSQCKVLSNSKPNWDKLILDLYENHVYSNPTQPLYCSCG